MNSRLELTFLKITFFILLCFETPSMHANTWIDDLILEGAPWYPCFCTSCECTPYHLEAEYLYWKIKESPSVVPLVFTGIFNENVTPTLNTPGTTIVLGNEPTRHDAHSGLKLTFGYDFLDPCEWSMELSYTLLETQARAKSVRSNDFLEDEVSIPRLPNNSFLAIPFFDVTTNRNSSVFIARPGAFAGKAVLRTKHWMQGGEWNFTAKLPITTCDCHFHIRGLVGFRYWNFNDELKFTTSSPNATTPDIFTTKDKFKTENSFYGVQVGFLSLYRYRFFSCIIKAKIALGAMDERLSIRGRLLTNDFNDFGEVLLFRGGYFALPTNIGFYDRWKFACLPELNLDLSFDICRWGTFHIGCNILYVSRILWAENQIDPAINTTQSVAITRQPFAFLSGIRRPKAPLKSKDFWVEGLTVGFEFIF